MTDLRREAKGRPCMVCSPVCTFDTETTVLAHIRMSGISGMGFKAPDLLGAWACYACHTLADSGRFNGIELTRDDRELLLLRGMARTQAQLLREGKLLCE